MEGKNANKKNMLTANQMIGELLLSIVLYGIIFFVLYRIIYSFIYQYFIENQKYILLAFAIIALQILMAMGMFSIANRKAFKRGNIYKNDVNKVIKNIVFIIVVILLLQAFSVFAYVDIAINKTLEKDFALQYKEKLLSYLYGEDEMTIYQIEKEKAIKKVKKQMYEYLAIVEIGIFTVYISAIFIEKKYLYNKAI